MSITRNFCKTVGNFRSLAFNRAISTTTVNNLDQKWRQERGLPMNPNSHGVLTDGPDYTYLDGRLTPYGVGQKNRIVKQREITEQIIKLSGEIDFAVERHKHLQEEEKDRRDNILKNKLKPKGVALLKSK